MMLRNDDVSESDVVDAGGRRARLCVVWATHDADELAYTVSVQGCQLVGE